MVIGEMLNIDVVFNGMSMDMFYGYLDLWGGNGINVGARYPLVLTFTVCELEHDPVEIVRFPIEHGDFPELW